MQENASRIRQASLVQLARSTGDACSFAGGRQEPRQVEVAQGTHPRRNQSGELVGGPPASSRGGPRTLPERANVRGSSFCQETGHEVQQSGQGEGEEAAGLPRRAAQGNSETRRRSNRGPTSQSSAHGRLAVADEEEDWPERIVSLRERAEAQAMPWEGERKTLTPRQALVRKVAAEVPPELRAQRALLMLEYGVRTRGVTEVRCPGCEGSGWEDAATLTKCPLCLGFQWVPYRIAMLMHSSAPAAPRPPRVYQLGREAQEIAAEPESAASADTWT